MPESGSGPRTCYSIHRHKTQHIYKKIHSSPLSFGVHFLNLSPSYTWVCTYLHMSVPFSVGICLKSFSRYLKPQRVLFVLCLETYSKVYRWNKSLTTKKSTDLTVCCNKNCMNGVSLSDVFYCALTSSLTENATRCLWHIYVVTHTRTHARIPYTSPTHSTFQILGVSFALL